jgi:uncharacterized protein YkwD
MKKFIIPIIAVLLVILGVTTYNLTQAPKPAVAQIKHDVSQVKPNPPTVSELFALVNAERAKVHVAPLTLDPKLNKSAQIKADDMNNNNYFGHVDKNGKHGYQYAMEAEPILCHTASENIFKGTGIYDTSLSAINWWHNSPPHYETEINTNYTIVGFGISSYDVVAHYC